MGSKAVKISEELVELARKESEVMCRSLGAQVEFWARLGREVESRGALGIDDIRALMAGGGSVQAFKAADDALYLDALSERLRALDGSDTRLLDDLRERGRSIASTDDDEKSIVEEP